MPGRTRTYSIESEVQHTATYVTDTLVQTPSRLFLPRRRGGGEFLSACGCVCLGGSLLLRPFYYVAAGWSLLTPRGGSSSPASLFYAPEGLLLPGFYPYPHFFFTDFAPHPNPNLGAGSEGALLGPRLFLIFRVSLFFSLTRGLLMLLPSFSSLVPIFTV